MKDIQGYEGLYAVTEDGRVWSYPKVWLHYAKHNGRFLKIAGTGRDYKYRKVVLVDKDGHKMNKSVHRLVAETYILNPKNLREVNHLDNNPSNNNVTNLEWCSSYHNLRQRGIDSGWSLPLQEKFNDMINSGIELDVALYSLS